MQRPRFDELTIVALAFLIFLGFNILKDQGLFAGLFSVPGQVVVNAASVQSAAEETAIAANEGAGLSLDAASPAEPAAAVADHPPFDPNVIIYPYFLQYKMTQGVHGAEYGHMAIDISAGNGATIVSPITGMVTEVFIDQYNNTNLIIENERFTVTMLHGNYSVAVGQWLSIGDAVGTESNNGYTLDAFGQPCAGRDCGYHTHLNVYDKQAAANVNPLEVLINAPPASQ